MDLRNPSSRQDVNPTELFRAGPPVKDGAVLGFLTVRNEALRLPAVLDHHRRLGIDQFVIVDNDSNDGTRDLLAAMPDVRLYSASGSFAASTFGLQWLHPLLDELADNHWALTLDADELFVFPRCERLTLHQLCDFLDRRGSDSMFAILLDMYSQSSIAATAYRQGEALLDASPFFDPGPYAKVLAPVFPYYELRGGPRARAFWTPTTSFVPPTVSKVPLVKWRRGYRYPISTHQMCPAPAYLSGITGALLHFKFLSDFHQRAEIEATRGEHFAGAREYKVYLQALQKRPDLSLHFAGSVRYQECNQLVSLKLCRTLEEFERFANLQQ
jgi:hypothetical protein